MRLSRVIIEGVKLVEDVSIPEWNELIGFGSFGPLKALGLPWGANSPPLVPRASATFRGVHGYASHNMRLLVC